MKLYNHSRRFLGSPSDDAGCHHRHNLNKILNISLTAFFFITIACLIYNAIKQCIRCHRRRRDAAADLRQEYDPAAMAQLRVIPVLVHGDDGPSESETCAVCLMECVKGEEVRVLPGCGHVFHKACVDEWLMRRSSFCPVCRGRVIERAVEPGNECASDGSGGEERATRLEAVPASTNITF